MDDKKIHDFWNNLSQKEKREMMRIAAGSQNTYEGMDWLGCPLVVKEWIKKNTI